MQALNIAIDEVSEFKLFMQRAKAGQDRLAEKLDPNLQPGNRAERRARERAERKAAKRAANKGNAVRA